MFVSFRDVGLEQIRTGIAWHYEAHQHEQRTQERLVYRDVGGRAKAAKRGYGMMRSSVPPWDWRRKTSRE